MALLVLVRRLVIAVIMAAGLAASPSLAVVTVQAGGFWFSGATPSDHVAPNTTFGFSFTLPKPLPPSLPSSSGYTTDAISDFQFQLDGIDVAMPIVTITFYDTLEYGMFDLVFADGESISLFGEDIGSTGMLSNGVFFFTAADTAGNETGIGGIMITGVAEPAEWALLIAGFALTGLALRGRRTAVAA